MRQVIFALCLAVAAAAPQKWSTLTEAKNVDASFEQTPFHKKPYKTVWEDFKNVHQKVYESVEEEIKRFAIFVENMKTIEMHNYLHSKGQKSYTLGLNEYADLKHEEFVSIMNGFKKDYKATQAKSKVTYLEPSNIALPDTVDWRTQGYVTPVKNQGQCGSCWAFSTTGSLEGQHFRQTGKLVSLSEQNLVDCSRSYGNNGCEGGLMDQAFEYIKDNHGIDTEKSYPYKAEDLKCHFKKKSVGANDTGFVDVTSGDEMALQKALATVGPISIAIDAGHRSFQLYDKGVYDEPECSSTQLDHGVLVVGYGTSDDGLDYWIVKNSWGPTWGVDGYVMMSRNKDNQCGVATQASYPLV